MSETANKRVAVRVALVAAGMLGLAFAAVPAYDLFCRVTGFGGTPIRADAASDRVVNETVIVRFDANVNGELGWEFKPKQLEMRVKLGENALALYTAKNVTSRTITGTATFNVAPYNVGAYFTKIDCFCFQEQTLKPGQSVDMPVAFYVDPELLNDKEATGVRVITLSYTFFESAKSAAATPRTLDFATGAARLRRLDDWTNRIR